ncbi:MAG: hypothetical protein IJH50_12380 [Kiritimatiellae bacterium]|nr:hypothetical protein [Kiritimatiellia bacterium]
MAVYFNDLTLDPNPSQNKLLLKEFQRVWADFSIVAGKKDSRILANEEALNALLSLLQDDGDYGTGVKSNAAEMELRHFLLTVLNRQYQDPSVEEWEKEAEDRFWGSEFSINIKPSFRPECKAMGWAFVNGSITLGLQSNFFWKKCEHCIVETDLEDVKQTHNVLCVTDRRHLDEEPLKKWLECRKGPLKIPTPETTGIPPEKKPVKVRDDHGREVLEEFGRKLNRSSYVTGIVNSTEWHPKCDRFILDCRADGIVYVCLHWTDNGLGLAVQTTGRGKAQTELIAQKLEEEFDHGS